MFLIPMCVACWGSAYASALDLSHATVVVRGKSAPAVEATAASVLIEEVAKRTGLTLETSTTWPESGAAIALLSGTQSKLHGKEIPSAARITKAEGYGIVTDTSDAARPVIWIVGADPRGALYGVGRLLRGVDWSKGALSLARPINDTTAPLRAIRGHQLGYRAHSNSYDALSVEQYDQYIRELALFGTNSIEGIPFQDTRPTVSGYPREKMNVDISRICEKYDVDYWVWTPADFDMNDAEKRANALKMSEDLFRACPRLDAVFFPGGDPGDNPAELVIPYLEDLSRLLLKHHPKAKIWPSMQGFPSTGEDKVYAWLESAKPDWIGGITGGPGSPPLPEIRSRLSKEYGLRDYPDITHSVRCQFPVPWWDPAFAFTLGRECINPRPLFFARVIRDVGPFTDGFISYSDGVQDDVNKVLWSSLSWDPARDVTSIIADYARFFFGSDIVEQAGAGILALERNFEGALAENGGVDATLALWTALEARKPDLAGNWRWQMCLFRAYYDAYIRHRLIHESGLEKEANARLLEAREVGVDQAIDNALAVLKRADTDRVHPEWLARIEALAADLFTSTGLQTSVEKYQASDPQRGAVLDFVNHPLNNRWWLEDELAKVRSMTSDQAKIERLATIATWENPGPGSFYDDIGNVGKSPHVVRGAALGGPLLDVDNTPMPGFMWWEKGQTRVRQSWISGMDWPEALKYVALDPDAEYFIRTTGKGECPVRVNGVRLAPTIDGKDIGEIKEFPIPKGLYRDGTITVTFDPVFEPTLNWRVQSRLTEFWLIKK